MTPTKPHPRSRRTAAEVAEKRKLFADLDSMIDAKEGALMNTLFEIKTWRPQRTAASLNKLCGQLREAYVQAEVLAELAEGKRRNGV